LPAGIPAVMVVHLVSEAEPIPLPNVLSRHETLRSKDMRRREPAKVQLAELAPA